ncbi:MAG: hypothetical protein IKV30_02245 [Clostridia bacterium]|nr:hypothetical protein [Clostridia bacterium]
MRGFIGAIDIRSSHVSAVVARVNSDDKLEILGKATRMFPVDGKNLYDNTERLAAAISDTFYEAKDEAQVEMSDAYIAFTTEKSGLMEVKARRDFGTSERVMEQTDAISIVSSGYDYPVPENIVVTDVVPRKFAYDDGEDTIFPWGKRTSFIQANVGLQVVDKNFLTKLRGVVARTQIRAVGYSLSGVATGYAVLTTEEKQDGAIVINVGSSHTDVSVFFDGTPVFCSTIPMGSDDCTKDISTKLDVTYEQADALRRMYGLAAISLIEDDHMVPIAVNSDCMLSDIVRIIESRYTKIFELADTLVAREDFGRQEPENVVITGLGASSTEGLTMLCDSVMKKKSRNGRILASFGGRVENVGAVGLAEYIFENIEYGKQTLFADFIARDEEPINVRKKSFFDFFKGKNR